MLVNAIFIGSVFPVQDSRRFMEPEKLLSVGKNAKSEVYIALNVF